MKKMKEPRDKFGVDSIEKMFKLTSNINTTNMVLINHQGKVTKYNSPEEIMDEFFDVRMEYYKRRKYIYLKIYKKRIKLNNL